jgi:inorganic pyrophosphatase
VKNIFSCFLLVFILCECEFKEKESFNNDINSLYAVIEIPAGTNIKYEYNYDSQSFDVDVVNGQKRIINYLPYPGNYGFIENTFMDPSLGGDGDALDVLVICESLNQSKKIKIDPIGIIKLLDDGEEDHKIIAIPNNDQESFMSDSIPESVKIILKTWFSNYKGFGEMQFISWGDKKEALKEIKKWKL